MLPRAFVQTVRRASACGRALNHGRASRFASGKADPAISQGANPPTPVLPLNIVEKPSVQASLPFIGNVAYLTLAGGFLMTDVLALRCLLATGYFALVGFHAFQLRPLRIPLVGSAYFVVVNAFFAVQIYLSRRVSLTDEEKSIHESHFSEDMADHEFQKLVRLSDVVKTDKSARLAHAGDVIENVFFIVEGAAQITIQEETHIEIHAGEFIGEGSFLRKVPHHCRGDIDALPGCKYMCWNIAKLKAALEGDSHVQRALEVKIGRELAHKLHQATDSLVRTNSHNLHDTTVARDAPLRTQQRT